MKKTITSLCSLMFLIGSVPLAHSSTTTDFTDVPTSHTNINAIYYLRDKGILSGYADNTFRPDTTVNRAELLKILVGGKRIKPEASQYHDCFPDVHTEWFAPYVCYAKEQQWVGGYPDGTFRPAQAVNKVEALKMLINSQDLSSALVPVTQKLYDDVVSTDWFAPYVKIAKDRNLLEEVSTMFGSASNMTRGGISENLFRSLFTKEVSASKFSQEDMYATKDTDHWKRAPIKVTKVVDGDTIEVLINGVTQKIRLIGIDTPETVDPRKPVSCYGPEASNKAKELLNNQYVYLGKDPSQGDTDKYDRLLRYVYLNDGTSYNEYMIREGFAREYTYNTAYKYQSVYKSAEQTAKSTGKGLWSACSTGTGTTTSGSGSVTTTPVTGNYDCTQNLYNCSDFATQAQAQAAYNYCWQVTHTDIHKLDADGNGKACENLP